MNNLIDWAKAAPASSWFMLIAAIAAGIGSFRGAYEEHQSGKEKEQAEKSRIRNEEELKRQLSTLRKDLAKVSSELQAERDKNRRSGSLKPSSSPLVIHWGSSQLRSAPGVNFLQMFQMGAPTISQKNSVSAKIVDGELKVSARIVGESSLVAEIIDNQWTVNPLVFDRNYTDKAFEVMDPNGDIVFQMRLEPDGVHFQGKFYDGEGRGVAYLEKPLPSGSNVYMTVRGMEKEMLQELKSIKIPPLFKYPSSENLGVMARR